MDIFVYLGVEVCVKVFDAGFDIVDDAVISNVD